MPPRRHRKREQTNSAQFYQQVSRYARNNLFGQVNRLTLNGNPYRRPIRPQDIDALDFERALPKEEFTSASALTAQRMLLNIYESDLLFLPNGPFEPVARDFRAFYGNDVKLAGEAVRPTLEQHVFRFLDDEVDVSGPWTLDAMRALFDNRLQTANASDSALMAAVGAARSPDAAATSFLIQVAVDFLSEASAMARNVLGNYGPLMSELFKVLIDEYGYGVFATKHSTLFEDTLKSVGLSPDIHAYWQVYLGSSIALTNYFHFVSRNHAHFFRYLGALYFTEATLPHTNRQQVQGLVRVFGNRIKTRYFDEHVHIDVHHARMVLKKIIEPTIERCGEGVIPEIVRGFEEFRLLQGMADEDLIAQLAWADRSDEHREQARRLTAERRRASHLTRFVEKKDELSVTHVHDRDELFLVESGEMDLITGHEQAVRLRAGDGIVIPKHRLHGSVVRSECCTYTVDEVA